MFYSRETGISDMPPLYVKPCQVFGTPMHVAIRREMSDIVEILSKQILRKILCQQMESGSHREGFRLNGSDVDTMVWPDNHRVIWNKSMSKRYTDDCILLLGDSNESPPGFTLLEILTKTDKTFEKPETELNGKIYVPSLKFKRDARLIRLPKSVVHGPCDRIVQGGVEIDMATCFACDFWPQSASSWIHRSRSLHWPNQDSIDDIVKNGCHVVPIGNPLSIHEDTEWRISFSLAEYKIVKSMNHFQFLVYGLLKIILKDVINQQSDESKVLLCSYHMKTAVFWTIQQMPMFEWSPHNLLEGFWMCFKLLLKWVYEGVCPNFFIPQNNMFRSKIYGSAQENLFLRLLSLYEGGLPSLLQRTPIIEVLGNTKLEVTFNYETVLFRELTSIYSCFSATDLHHCMEILRSIEGLIGTPMTENQTVVLQKQAATIIRLTVFMLHNTMKSNKSCNSFDISCHMLEVAANLGLVSDNAYIAIYYYKTKRYAKALSVISEIKKKLCHTQQCQTGNYTHLYVERCTMASGEHIWLTNMIEDIIFSSETCFIQELLPEQLTAKQNVHWIMKIPLFVAIEFVEFLCSRHIDTLKHKLLWRGYKI